MNGPKTLDWPSRGEALTRVAGSGGTWSPTVIKSTLLSRSDLDNAISESAPSNVQLLDLVSQSAFQPPQEWWDETDDPFSPDPD